MSHVPGSAEPHAADRDAALRLMTVCSRALRAVMAPLRRQLRQWDLSPTEFGVLEALHHRGPLPLGELAERILVTGASTTYTVKALEARGLLRRRPCGEDQRVVFGELTDAGRALIAEVFPAHAEEMRRVMGALSTDEKQHAATLLKRLGLGAAERGAPSPTD